ncbi:MAG: molybdopterin molybdenumtransferase MoeA [Spirochaetes bacterium]|mgnify:CR=1 FL=1|nr:molybdopterin molybdenumtransferase MoeA [Spirochaetota bacterium]
MLQVKTVDEVFKIIREEFSLYPLETEQVPLIDACGRILAEDIISPENIPPFNRSSVDGYAVYASDTFGATETAGIPLVKSDAVKMGITPSESLKRGHASYIPTGGELPANADAVVMIEYTEDNEDEFIYINRPVAPGNNVVLTGDDIKMNSAVFSAGHRLKTADSGVLASIGVAVVKVKRRLRVGIIATGDEIIPVSASPVKAQVRDINSHVLYAALKEYCAEPVMYGIYDDNYEKIKCAAASALNECDILCISGGSSAGEKDETANIIDSLGRPGLLVHGIAVKPGKPTIIGRAGNKPVIGLPGHPASAFMIYTIFVKYLMDRMNGALDGAGRRISATIPQNYPSNAGREEFVPVKLHIENSICTANPLFGKSGQIKMLSDADGYIHIKRESEGLMAGRPVEVILF